MKRFKIKDYVSILVLVVLICMILQSWDALIGFLGILFTAVAPLAVGIGIAYVVSIPCNFLERHIALASDSPIMAAIRKPLSLVVTVVCLVAGIILSSLVLLPALVDTFTMVQRNGQQFVEDVIQLPFMEPVRDAVHNFLEGDLVQSFKRLDVNGIAKVLFSGNAGSITTQVFGVVSSVMTGFFGLLFSFILLTDTSHTTDKIMPAIAEYLGPKRTERIALVIGVTDASFHNFIVRQCLEAFILGGVGMLVLLATGYPYALGVGVLMALAALVPIVGYPVGLVLGAFMIAINNVWLALLYVVVVATAQLLESTFVLPHVGDPRTALPPVWITVGVTIGGGVAGFLGMLVAIPITATIRQLIVIDMRRRQNARKISASREAEKPEEKTPEEEKAEQDGLQVLEAAEAILTEGLVDDDGNGVGEIQ